MTQFDPTISIIQTEKTEAQRCEVTCPRSHSKYVEELKNSVVGGRGDFSQLFPETHKGEMVSLQPLAASPDGLASGHFAPGRPWVSVPHP